MPITTTDARPSRAPRKTRPMTRRLGAVLLPFFVAGCGLPPAVSVAVSEKTVADHALSQIVQKDCSKWRGFTGDEPCIDEDSAFAVAVAADSADLGAITTASSLIEDGSMDLAMGGDWATALRELRPQAEQGFAGAQLNLGSMYHLGEGVPQDYAEAVRWYRKAAEQGHANAQLKLSRIYHLGQGMPQDYAEAMKWYRKAAEQGNVQAQNALGFMYEHGQGVPKDNAEALRWLHKAAAQGNKLAVKNVRRLEGRQRFAKGLTKPLRF